MSCREFFKNNAENKERCKALQAIPLHSQLAWEKETASEFSPGLLTHDELLCRHVVNPQHFDPVNRAIKPTFFDDASDKGASVNRLGHTTVEAIQQGAQTRVNKTNENPPQTGPRELIGYTTVTTAEVRQISAGEPLRQGLSVYDTANFDDISHADICQLVGGKQEGKSVRAQLYQLAKSRLVLFPSA